MKTPLVDSLADFAVDATLEDLPDVVVEDCKRVLLDSIGCGLAGVGDPKSVAGVECARVLGGEGGDASLFGTSFRSSVFGAAFANGESINALDFDAVLPPGHVAPYVLPGALAIAESSDQPGRRLIEAIAVAHEVSHRFGKAMDNHRTPKNGEQHLPDVLGFTSTVFGATLANTMLLNQPRNVTADSVGIAAAISPVNSHRPWIEHLPNSSIKYTMAGPITQAGLTAAYSARFGHTGDRQILDDAELGYPRFIGTGRWDAEPLRQELGSTWTFPQAHSYKPYPHCRVTHGPLDAVLDVVTRHDVRADEIDEIRCWGEEWVNLPLWLKTDLDRPHEAQMSIAYGLAVAAHRIPIGAEWQTPETLHSPSVRDLMAKVSFRPHPDYARLVGEDPSARPTHVDIDARGETFSSVVSHPKGTPSSDERTYMTTEEIVDKFRTNADGVIDSGDADRLVTDILSLEEVKGVRELMSRTRGHRGR